MASRANAPMWDLSSQIEENESLILSQRAPQWFETKVSSLLWLPARCGFTHRPKFDTLGANPWWDKIPAIKASGVTCSK